MITVKQRIWNSTDIKDEATRDSIVWKLGANLGKGGAVRPNAWVADGKEGAALISADQGIGAFG